MAYRYEGGIDFSEALGAIAGGMERAAQLKRQQDQLAEARIDDFLKMYQPGKLRSNDIPDFVNAYNQFKESALNFKRMSRSGKDPDAISTADIQMKRALAGLNDVYSKSATVAEKQAEYADYFKTARAKGYEVPNEVSGFANALTSSKLSDLDVDKIPSAYTFDLTPKEIDWKGISDELDRTQARIKDIETVRADVPFGNDVNGNPIFAQSVTKYVGRDPQSTVDYLTLKTKSNPKLYNAAKDDYSLLYQGVQSQSKTALDRFDEIKTYFPNIKSIEDVTPEMALGLQFYRKQSQGTIIDKSAAERAYQTALDKAKLAQGQQKINISLGKESEPTKRGKMIEEVNRLLSSPTQPSGAPVDRLSLTSQEELVNLAEKVLNYKVPSSNMYMRLDKDSGIPYLYATQDITQTQGGKKTIIVKANERIGPIAESGEITTPSPKPPSQQPVTKTINESQLSQKARASGYTVQEYIKLLRSYGIQIIKGK